MTSILLCGHGRMGRCLEELIREAPDLALAGILEPGSPSPLSPADAAVDFSHPGLLPRSADYARRTGAALVCGTTGLSSGDHRLLRELAEAVPVLWSANFSLGAAALRQTAARMAAALPDFDIEILEAHHRGKEDAPSGTARLLLEAVDPESARVPVWGRQGRTGPRDPREIGVHSIRGGTEAGTHTVLFLGPEETLEVTHRAASRAVFARGALRAARALAGRPPGLYTLEEVLLEGGREKK